MGLDQCIDKLMDPAGLPTSGPRNPGKIKLNDVLVPVEESFISVDEPWVWKQDGKWMMGALPQNQEKFVNVLSARAQSLRSWKMESIYKEGISIYEKMTMFWNNHFSVVPENPPLHFLSNMTLMENALGNFRDLVKKMTIDPAMLIFLNGNENTAKAPNENFARELFELFTIGKGDQVAPGDYSNYTETDILEAARVLTGWIIDFSNLVENNKSMIELSTDALIHFNGMAHDADEKQFSSRFNNQMISNKGPDEYLALIDMIFSQPECARFICRKLYRWFVYYDISIDVEDTIIESLAKLLVDHDYEVRVVLEALLKSEHFFESIHFGGMIKNPYDFLTSMMKPFQVQHNEPEDPYLRFILYLDIYHLAVGQQMAYFNPPSVAGWKAYYQAPLFYRTWINASTLNLRMTITRGLSMSVDPEGQRQGLSLQVLFLVELLNNSEDPNKLVSNLSKLFFTQDITQDQRDYLKGILIPGLPDFEWTIEYGNYINDPENRDLSLGVELKLRQLIHAMLTMPEFYLS
ncbi:MAG: DUF1800 domain-containing protein [Saprospiraceae bacterium]|nr:DUF1800 domain-containing protein [Saprospiraceae bacterium]